MENNSQNGSQIKYTIHDLMLRPIGKIRHKAIGTLAKRKGLSYERARAYQANKILENEPF